MRDTTFAATVDARAYEPVDKHRVIFETYDRLAIGETMELVNDHDPKPLYYQFSYEKAGEFEWDYLETGPVVWRVAIKKIG